MRILPVYRKLKALYDAQKAAQSFEKANLAPGVTVGFDYRIRQEVAGNTAMRRIASPMAGGLITLTIVTLILMPVIYEWWYERKTGTN
ncbi:MAG: hypothetical protein ACOCX9_01630 [Spirochaetota bacterium]